MNPTVGQVHVNRPLTNVSLAFVQSAEAFVADKVFPTIPVSNKSDVYYTYDRSYFNRDEAKERAPGTESAGGGYGISTDDYSAKVYAYHKDIDDQIRANADSPVNLDRDAALYVTTVLKIRQEKSWVDKYFKTGVWGYDYDGVSGSPGANEVKQWNDSASTPIEDVRAGQTYIQSQTGFRPNTLVMGRAVYDKLLDHPDIVDRIKYGQTPGSPALATRQILAAIFDVERVFVMEAIENTAKEGQTGVHGFIGGKKAALFYAPPTPGLMTPSAGYTFAWQGYLNGTASLAIKKFRMEQLESDRVEGSLAYDQKLVSNALGAFWDTVIA